jgi:hypothetical protein
MNKSELLKGLSMEELQERNEFAVIVEHNCCVNGSECCTVIPD